MPKVISRMVPAPPQPPAEVREYVIKLDEVEAEVFVDAWPNARLIMGTSLYNLIDEIFIQLRNRTKGI